LASEAKGRGFDPRQPHHILFLVAVILISSKLLNLPEP
jgi:hypothetical protein